MNKTNIIIGLLAIIGGAVFSYQGKIDNDPYRLAYVETIAEYAENDTDLRDYNIDPKKMAECVLEGTERGMRGFIDSSLTRREQLVMFTNWIRIKNGETVFNNVSEVREFGMKIVGQGVHTAFGTSYQYCVERVAPHSQEDILAKEDWIANKVNDISKWWEKV